MSKRLLIVTPSFPPEGSGAAQYYAELVAEVPEHLEVHLLTTWTGKEITGSSIHFHPALPSVVRSFFLIRILLLPLWTFFWILFFRLRKKIDVVQVHSSTAITLGVVFASITLGIPIVYDVQDMQAPLWLLRFGRKPKYLTVGEAVTQRIRDMGIAEARILEISSLVPSTLPKDLPRRESNQFIFVGSLLKKAKGLDVLIEAMRAIGKTNTACQLKIIGTGKDLKWLQKEIRTDLWLASHIKILGELSHDEVLREMARSQALILPSLSEAVPRVIIEAFSLGTPVIATRVGSVPKLIGDNERGVLIPTNDAQALEQAMYQMLRHDEVVSGMSDAARKYAQTMPSWADLRRKIYHFTLGV
ncbi:MAG: glycosyltransferase family 4 protein [Candidatus Nomurabacteria bacterium]|nr:MAG: glycosyltransferase family 4 protein [Candidatus Nomurabacteria bacterium]